jgi:hypothetical protein
MPQLSFNFVASSSFSNGIAANTEGVVQTFFRNILRREPDEASLRGFVKALNEGMPVEEFFERLITSDEVRLFVDPIVRLYQVAFGRAPDAQGLDGWVNALRSGALSLDEITRAFVTSPEFVGLHGAVGLPEERLALLKTWYAENLGRPLDVQSEGGWADPAVSLAAVLGGIGQSVEFIGRADPALAQYYASLVGNGANAPAPGQSLFDLLPASPSPVPPSPPAGQPPAANPPAANPPVVTPPSPPADTTPPTVSISFADPLMARTETLTAAFTFSEDVQGFDAADVDLPFGFRVTNLQAISGSSYTIDIAATGAATPVGTSALTIAPGSYTDVGGNPGAAGAASLTFDADEPNAPTVTTAAPLTTDTTPTVAISGVETGATVQVTFANIGTTATFSGAATFANGGWTFTPSAALPFGSYNVSATATDAAGNPSSPSAGLRVVIDPPAPAAPTITGFSDNTGDPTDNITSDDTPTFTGTVSNDAVRVNLFDPATNTIIGIGVAANGLWSASVAPSSNGIGPSAVTAVAVNLSGTSSVASDVFRIFIDRTAPTAPVISGILDDRGAQVTITRDTTPTVRLAGVESGATPEVSMTDRATNTTVKGLATLVNGVWSFTPDTPLASGQYAVTATATDVAGNRSPSSNASIVTVDAIAPAPVITLSKTILGGNDRPTVTFAFQEDVFDFSAADIALSPGYALTNLTPATGRVFTATLEPSPNQTIDPNGSITVAADGYRDLVGNPGVAARTTFEYLGGTRIDEKVLANASYVPSDDASATAFDAANNAYVAYAAPIGVRIVSITELSSKLVTNRESKHLSFDTGTLPVLAMQEIANNKDYLILASIETLPNSLIQPQPLGFLQDVYQGSISVIDANKYVISSISDPGLPGLVNLSTLINVNGRTDAFGMSLGDSAQNGFPSVAMGENGDIALTWVEDGQIKLLHRDNGVNTISTIKTANGRAPDVAMDVDGDFVVFWEQEQSSAAGAFDVVGQRFNSQGDAVGDRIQVGTPGQSERKPSVAMADNGSFVVGWQTGTGDTGNIVAQRFMADGTKFGAEITVAQYDIGLALSSDSVSLSMDGTQFAVSMHDRGFVLAQLWYF